MSFAHPEFFLWMTPFVLLLFYFWLTQKTQEEDVFTQDALDKLRVEDQTMGLKGRNSLFLSASLLIITALAQPVARGERLPDSPKTIMIALDISKRSLGEFEAMKQNAIRLITITEGAIEIIAFNEKLYRIAPRSEDKTTLKELVANLSPRVMNSSIADENGMRKRCNPPVLVVVSGEKIRRDLVDDESEKWEAIPLFYVPLGLAILLIAIALSSMSKRESVSLAMLALLFMGEKNLNAGVLDFTILNHAYSAYEAGEYAKSAQYFKQYQQLHDSPQVRYNYANALFKAGDYERARYWYEHSTATDPQLVKWVAFNRKKLSIEEEMAPQSIVNNKVSGNAKKEGIKVKNSIQIGKGTVLFGY
jgi:tetratricopeptide (TPR) repeat protein